MAEEPGVSQEAHGSYIAQATGGGHASIQVYASAPSQNQKESQNRARFLVRLRTRYHDLLDQSLHGSVRVALTLAGYPEAVAPPVRLLSQSEPQPPHSVPAGTPLSLIYAEAGHELLLLGEPGAGKSTLLLELARDLVEAAQQDQSQGLPMIVPLSSWASKRPALEIWLTEQVALLYDISPPLARRWVREEWFLPR
jgi:Cdc6-like AAA superfamily ATPase